jgi:hypothetical protein
MTKGGVIGILCFDIAQDLNREGRDSFTPRNYWLLATAYLCIKTPTGGAGINQLRRWIIPDHLIN